MTLAPTFWPIDFTFGLFYYQFMFNHLILNKKLNAGTPVLAGWLNSLCHTGILAFNEVKNEN